MKQKNSETLLYKALFSSTLVFVIFLIFLLYYSYADFKRNIEKSMKTEVKSMQNEMRIKIQTIVDSELEPTLREILKEYKKDVENNHQLFFTLNETVNNLETDLKDGSLVVKNSIKSSLADNAYIAEESKTTKHYQSNSNCRWYKLEEMNSCPMGEYMAGFEKKSYDKYAVRIENYQIKCCNF